MIEIKNIFPECDADTLLVELITGRGHANHNKGVSKVSKALKRNGNKQGPIIGLIDSDKFKRIHEDPYIPAFSELVCDLINQREKLRLKKLPNKRHYLIFIHPEFEPWIWAQSKLVDVDPSSYGYSNYKEFEDDSKDYGLSESIRFKTYVNAIVQANPPGIITLRRWLVANDFQ
jgi:hypothetical protein